MRKILSVLLVFMLVVAMAVPAMAAEPYIFDWLDIAYLPVFDLPPGHAYPFGALGFLPEGVYDVSLSDGSSGDIVFVTTVNIVYEVSEADGSMFFYTVFPNTVMPNDVLTELALTVLFDSEYDEMYALLAFPDGDYTLGGGIPFSASSGTQLHFVPVVADSVDVTSSISAMVVDLQSVVADYNGNTLSLILFNALLISVASVFFWFAYRFVKGKVVKSFFRGKM